MQIKIGIRFSRAEICVDYIVLIICLRRADYLRQTGYMRRNSLLIIGQL